MSVTRVAEYLRMSTDRQDLSITVQRDAIRRYAAERCWAIVASYEDAGRSGLTLEGRPAMQRLLKDVMVRPAPFTHLLVYDVSRWGRFQNTDASAYHEYHCKLNGVEVIYVAEPFGNETGPMGALLKSLKRAMAAEYSRELGIKVSAGQQRAISLGYQMGSPPCIGFRRVAVRSDGGGIRELQRGERCQVGYERTRWVRGPQIEVEWVQRIFEMYAQPHISMADIVQHLSGTDLRSRQGKQITRAMVKALLHSEAVIGNFVWGQIDNMPSVDGLGMPCRISGAVDPIVSKEVWEAVQAKFARQHWDHRTAQELIDELRAALQKDPNLSAHDLGRYGCATRKIYEREFGSMVEAYRRAGRSISAAHHAYLKHRAHNWHLALRMFHAIYGLLRQLGVHCAQPRRRRVFELQGARVRLQLVFRQKTKSGLMWIAEKYGTRGADFVLIARVSDDETVADLFLVSEDVYRTFPRATFKDDRPKNAVWVDSIEALTVALRQLAAGVSDGTSVVPHPAASGPRGANSP